MAGPLTPEELSRYRSEGFHLQRGLLAPDEVALVLEAARGDAELAKHSFGRDDGEGGNVRLSLWNHPGDDIYGAVARSARVVDRAEQLVGGEVYHYHSKMVQKDAREGGAWTWHQDYGYWYENGLLYPDLVSMFIALDPATRENGCLQVVPGSHLLGRIDHILTGEQAGAEPERMAAILDRSEVMYAELEAGDALFFHSNLLHRSDSNRSEHPRWSLICCYNSAQNDPVKEHHHPGYTPLSKLPDEAIRAAGAGGAVGGSDWLDPSQDRSALHDS